MRIALIVICSVCYFASLWWPIRKPNPAAAIGIIDWNPDPTYNGKMVGIVTLPDECTDVELHGDFVSSSFIADGVVRASLSTYKPGELMVICRKDAK